MSKVITIASTRPDLIRLSLVIKKLDKILGKDHIFIHTGQNFTEELHNQFFEDLGLRKPDYQFNLDDKTTGVLFAGRTMINIETLLHKFNPRKDKVLILGDVNGALYSSIVAKKMGFKIFHMEAGNRCYDDIVPEEINRRMIDSNSYKLLTYTQRSRENLLREGYHPKDIIVVGNPIYNVIHNYYSGEKHDVDNRPKGKHVLITFHRTENITDLCILGNFKDNIEKLLELGEEIYLSVHPKLESIMKARGWKWPDNNNLHINKPFTFTEFLKLEATAKCVITDSGTVPEECSIFQVPCILLRDSTERPELLEDSYMIVTTQSGLLKAYKSLEHFDIEGINIPMDYLVETEDTVVKLLIGEL